MEAWGGAGEGVFACMEEGSEEPGGVKGTLDVAPGAAPTSCPNFGLALVESWAEGKNGLSIGERGWRWTTAGVIRPLEGSC